MSFFRKNRHILRPFQIFLGLSLIITGVITSNGWFFLGIIPLISGITNFCPICTFAKKCSI